MINSRGEITCNMCFNPIHNTGGQVRNIKYCSSKCLARAHYLRNGVKKYKYNTTKTKYERWERNMYAMWVPNV